MRIQLWARSRPVDGLIVSIVVFVGVAVLVEIVVDAIVVGVIDIVGTVGVVVLIGIWNVANACAECCTAILYSFRNFASVLIGC